MLKCEVLDNIESGIKFEDIEVGETFVIDEVGMKWIGMKVKDGASYEEGEYFILDLSDEIGRLYSDVNEYKIDRLIDLKVVEDEGDE